MRGGSVNANSRSQALTYDGLSLFGLGFESGFGVSLSFVSKRSQQGQTLFAVFVGFGFQFGRVCRSVNLSQFVDAHLRIDLSAIQFVVAEQGLYKANVRAVL